MGYEEDPLDSVVHIERRCNPDRRECEKDCTSYIKIKTTVRLLMAVVIIDLVFNASPLLFAKDILEQINHNTQTIKNHDKQLDEIHLDVKNMTKELSNLTGVLSVIYGIKPKHIKE